MRTTSWYLSPTVMSSRKTPSNSKPNRLFRLPVKCIDKAAVGYFSSISKEACEGMHQHLCAVCQGYWPHSNLLLFSGRSAVPEPLEEFVLPHVWSLPLTPSYRVRPPGIPSNWSEPLGKLFYRHSKSKRGLDCRNRSGRIALHHRFGRNGFGDYASGRNNCTTPNAHIRQYDHPCPE
jgi:hypothetical protein